MHEPETTRRGFFTFVTSLLMAAIGLLILIPAVRYLLAPLWRKGGQLDFADVGPLSEIPVGEWRLVSLETTREDGWRLTRTRHSVWVRRTGETDKDIAVLSSTCPHLGCPINWHPQASEFVCPCHGGRFDVVGRQAGGPPPRGMDALEFEVRAGRLWVRWQDFKIGVDKSVPMTV
jgi:Rieske Fe-S protein